MAGMRIAGLPLPSPSRASRAEATTLLELDLTRGLVEAPPSTPLQALRERGTPSLRSVIDALRRAADDERVGGLVAHVGGAELTFAQAGELRSAVAAFRASGRTAVCWTESFGEWGPGNVTYHLACAFEEIWLQPSGDVGLTGVVAGAVFLRGALDKLDVEPQIGQRHEYKTAADTFLRTEMSDAHREMAERLAASATEFLVADVAADRGLTPEQVRAVIDEAPVTGERAVEHGLVDRLGYRHDVYAALRERLGGGTGAGSGSGDVELKYVERYGKGVGAAIKATATRGRPVIAVVQGSGTIHLGRSNASPLARSESIGADTFGAALRAAGRDDDVKAVVVRVDSGGGSYVASDAIRREVLALREAGTPVIASMGSVAASGGYFIAMAADEVLADAGTLTGSIGVLAGKQVLAEALGRIGVNVQSVSTGRYAEMFSSQRRFTDEEWARLGEWLDRVYDDFTAKAAADRGMGVEDLRAVARGRVWTGADAQRHGLVDILGGLDDAVGRACARAGLDRRDVEVRPFPRSNALARMMPAENSDHPAAMTASLAGAAGSWHALLEVLGLPPVGVLSMPVRWQLR